MEFTETSEKQNITASGEISRRKFLKMGLVTAATGILPCKAIASVQELLSDERSICLYNLHTKEYLSMVYWKDGDYLDEAMKDINFIFRDHYNGVIKPIDRKLLDFLCAIQRKLNCQEPFHLISGYRSPDTNAKLRKHNRGVAKRSLHIKGQAADIRLPDRSLKELKSTAHDLEGGGVGYYPRSNFVHVDVGRVRFWRS